MKKSQHSMASRTLLSAFLCVCVSIAGGCGTGRVKVHKAPHSLESGLYSGKRGWGIHNLFYVDVGRTATVEVYQPLKGQMFEVAKDILLPTSENGKGIRFSGKAFDLLQKEDGFYLVQTGQIAQSPGRTFKDVRVEYHPEHIGELNANRNRAFLARDFDRAVDAFEGSIEIKVKFTMGFERLWYEHGVPELAKSLPHEEFLVRYGKIRERIISELTSKATPN